MLLKDVIFLKEKIYTIPVNEAFSKGNGCPFCTLRAKLEDEERELIMGASMMEPDIRILTNKLGFCKKHFEKMLTMNNKLGLALILESHLKEVLAKTRIYKDSLFAKDNSKKAYENMRKIHKTCYICERVDEKFEKMMLCAVYLWEHEEDFREKCKNQKFFCFEHLSTFLEYASIKMDKKNYAKFVESIGSVQDKYIEELCEDVSWFCKKFDYRYENEPWGNSKDSVERCIKVLEGEY